MLILMFVPVHVTFTHLPVLFSGALIILIRILSYTWTEHLTGTRNDLRKDKLCCPESAIEKHPVERRELCYL